MGWFCCFLLVASIGASCTVVGDDYGTPGDVEPAPGPKLDDPVAVVRVIDGDTVEVMLDDGETMVRMKGIDSPELHPDPQGSPAEPYATDARDFTQANIGLRVELEFNSDCDTDPLAQCRDQYDRLLAYVRLQNGDDMALRLLRAGLARVYRFNNGNPMSFDRLGDYLAAEDEARQAGRGVWSP